MRRELCGECGEPYMEDGTCDCPPLPYEQTYDGLKERLAAATKILTDLVVGVDWCLGYEFTKTNQMNLDTVRGQANKFLKVKGVVK